ncbi:fimbrillin family protein [uncultured Mucilaginibacter sp.]|uniref:fimbrillin family protein n=1 Tax=uncultured Mucilaginibacter sp. TaxID=797541 RepID=UPI0025D4D067|nr:fimbrillin family protein [uncultured Mucilaginibacter sp.]
MKIQNILVATSMSLLVLGSSCKKDKNNKPEVTDPRALSAVKFTSSINGQIKTKAVGDKWEANDAIGVYMKTGTGLSNILAANKSYATNGDGAFAASATDQTIYYPENGAVDFIAYYPYKTSLTGTNYPVDVAVQNNQSAIDLLYSANATGLSKTSTTANLVFTHQLSKIEFTVKNGAGVADLNGLTVSLGGQNTKADFDLATGTLANQSATADISAKTTAQNATVLAEAIVLPLVDASGKVVIFSLPAGQFKLTLPAATKFEAGKKYTYEIELKNETSTNPNPVAVALSASITNWTTVPGGSYTVGQDPVTNPQPGTETVLYTENFGTGDIASTARPKIAAYTEWKNTSWTFSDPFAAADLRTISTLPGDRHIWLPAAKDAVLKIDGVKISGFTKIKLKYDLAPNASSSSSVSDVNVIAVKVNGNAVTVPSRQLTNADNNKFVTVELSNIAVKDNNTIEFIGGASNNLGMRLDNVTVIGVN